MTTTRKNAKTRKTPITIRKTKTGYRVNTRRREFANHGKAFDAAWADAWRLHRPLYGITPDRRRILMLDAATIRDLGK